MYIPNFKFPGVFAALLVTETTTLGGFYPTAFIGFRGLASSVRGK
jgi:hypothetical protein